MNNKSNKSSKSFLTIVFTVLGLLFPPLFIIGIIFGHLARKEFKENPELKGEKLAFYSLIVSYVLILPCMYIFLTCIPSP
jgi:Mg2+ and Co2+ transporter CorA